MIRLTSGFGSMSILKDWKNIDLGSGSEFSFILRQAVVSKQLVQKEVLHRHEQYSLTI